MRFEERIIWVIQQLLASLNTDGGHILMLGVSALIALKYQPNLVEPIGAALFVKIKA